MKKTLLIIVSILMLTACGELKKEATRKQLAVEARLANLTLKGMIIDTGIVCEGCEFKDDKFTYYYTLDENVISIESLKETEEVLIEGHKEELKQVAIGNDFFKKLGEIEGTVTFHYTGDMSGENIVITLNVPN
ncbi:MAG: hypothetical protein IKJ97_06305 [Bacteroidaceae bacterium]|nr:hypothetical protein [Bacteroidaceae bacterium]